MASSQTDSGFVLGDGPAQLLIYALGGGWGHLNRALSLARRAARKNYRVKVLSNSPYAGVIKKSRLWSQSSIGLIQITNPMDEIENFPSEAHFEERKKVLASYLQELFSKEQFSCFVVDTFPRGISAELVDLLPQLKGVTRVFVHRDINPSYVMKYRLRSFVEANFELLINPGEGNRPPLFDLCRETQSWLILDYDELRKRDELRESFGIGGEEFFLLVVAGGKKEEKELFTCLAASAGGNFPRVKVRVLCAEPDERKRDEISYWPGFELVRDADLVLSSAAYNIVSECRAMQIPLCVCPQTRLYDRQLLRASAYELPIIEKEEQLLNLLSKSLEWWSPARRPPSTAFENGSKKALSLMERVWTT